MNYEGLTLDKENGVAIITLNRPQQLNAITQPMIQSLARALDEVEKDESSKVLILTGAGRGFCAGLDVSTFELVEKMSQKELADSMRLLSLPIYELSKPTIAAINGPAVGAGLAIALLCDMRIASEAARFSTAYVRMGIIPDVGATYSLTKLLGPAKAMDLMVTGDTFDAAEAQRMGLVSRVLPEGDLIRAARELASRIVAGPSIAIELMKQAVHRAVTNNLDQQIEFECFADYICLRTDDHKEGAKAFLEKRPPKFKGT